MLDPHQLITDTRLLSAYASRRGLQLDNPLNQGIVAAEAKLNSHSFTTADEQTLNDLINTAAKLVSPVTVEQLRMQDALERGDWSFRILFFRVMHFATQASVFLVCFLLIFLIIPLTTEFNRLSVILSELKEIEKDNYFQEYENVMELKPEDNHRAEGIRKLRDLSSKIIVTITWATQMFDLADGSPNWGYIILSNYGMFRQYTVVVTPIVSANPPPQLSDQEQKKDSLSPTPQLTTADSPAASSPTQEQVKGVFDTASDEFTLGIWQPSQLQTPYLARRYAEGFSIFLGSSLLPLLYGLLGSSVFLMRNFMGQQRRLDPLSSPLEGTIFLRLGLGAIAGIAIGWFWVPESAANATAEVAHLSTTPFAVAFLAGFSIELLFSLLDRIIAAISPAPPTAGRP